MKRLKTSALLLIAVGFMASCSYKTCPAYSSYVDQPPQGLQANTQLVSPAAASTAAKSDIVITAAR